jgi:FAD/FMN-containing dehydrogenase
MTGPNRIEAEKIDTPPISEVRSVKDPMVIGSDYPAYLIDESKMTGWADFLFFPRSEGELASVLNFLRGKEARSYISGARTGISGSAVPHGGGIISSEKMSSFRSPSLRSRGCSSPKEERGSSISLLTL